MKILVATTNPGKISELRAMLAELDSVEWLSLDSFPSAVEVEEDGDTFEENSAKKAMVYAKQTGLWTVADDSGLVIDALGGAPGVNSARFSGEKTVNDDGTLIDHRNIEKVLGLMQEVPKVERTCRFVCCITLASPQKVLLQTRGTLEGVITTEKLGTGGFGYDPIVYVPNLDKTVAQLSRKQKNEISHRSCAIKKLKPLLIELLKKQ